MKKLLFTLILLAAATSMNAQIRVFGIGKCITMMDTDTGMVSHGFDVDSLLGEDFRIAIVKSKDANGNVIFKGAFMPNVGTDTACKVHRLPIRERGFFDSTLVNWSGTCGFHDPIHPLMNDSVYYLGYRFRRLGHKEIFFGWVRIRVHQELHSLSVCIEKGVIHRFPYHRVLAGEGFFKKLHLKKHDNSDPNHPNHCTAQDSGDASVKTKEFGFDVDSIAGDDLKIRVVAIDSAGVRHFEAFFVSLDTGRFDVCILPANAGDTCSTNYKWLKEAKFFHSKYTKLVAGKAYFLFYRKHSFGHVHHGWVRFKFVFGTGKTNAFQTLDFSVDQSVLNENEDQTTTAGDGAAVTGMNEQVAASAAQITVYPNPASHTLQVRLGEQAKAGAVLNVLNMQGQIVHSTSVSQGAEQVEVSVENLAPGMYFLSGMGQTIRFIKN